MEFEYNFKHIKDTESTRSGEFVYGWSRINWFKKTIILREISLIHLFYFNQSYRIHCFDWICWPWKRWSRLRISAWLGQQTPLICSGFKPDLRAGYTTPRCHSPGKKQMALAVKTLKQVTCACKLSKMLTQHFIWFSPAWCPASYTYP